MASQLHSSAPPRIPGYQIPNEAAIELKEQVAKVLGRGDNLRFPGAQPVSFAREHIAELQRQEYFMCEKTDGIRCLLYLTWRDAAQIEPVTILIDRKNSYYEVTPPVRIPYYQSPDRPDQFLFETILDGELVNDRSPQGGTKLIFYVFDCLVIDGQNMTERTLDKRLGYMKEKLFRPWTQQLLKTRSMMPLEPFQLKEKQFQPPYALTQMFDQVLPNLKHGNDGLIFTCKNTRYVFGTDKHILKWKPPHENTIDFKLRLGDFPLLDETDSDGTPIPDYDAMPSRFILLVYHGRNDYRPFAHDLHVDDQEWAMLKGLEQRLDGRIIECFRDDHGRWCMKKEDDGTPRWRDDKPDANHISTVDSVLESIQDPVTEHDLRAAERRIAEAIRHLREEEKKRVLTSQHYAYEQENTKKRKYSEADGGLG